VQQVSLIYLDVEEGKDFNERKIYERKIYERKIYEKKIYVSI